LIITNHHCVFGAVASASSPEHNYLENGFYAKNEAEEIKTSLPCKITLSFDDVSDRVLKDVDPKSAPEEQQQKIENNIKAITEAEKEAYPDLKIEISEMFVGKYYTLFRYKMLNDVRLVYVPPKAVGKFGGETDNWIWPRHNGDFSVVRAYENGKPYKPERHLKIDVNGTQENDFVFVLGYPGSTYRHFPAQYLTYQNDHLLPLISSWFDERIALLKQDAKGSVAKELQYASTIASLSNTTKNFKGKMQGLRRTSILENRFEVQDKLQQFALANGDPEMYSASVMYFAAHMRNSLKAEYDAQEKSERKNWLDNSEKLMKRVKSGYRVVSTEMDYTLFGSLLYRIYKSGDGRADKALAYLNLNNPSKKEMIAAVAKLWNKSKYANKAKTLDWIENNPKKFIKAKDKIQDLAAIFAPQVSAMRSDWVDISAELDALMPRLADIKQKHTGGNFIPDANATLRLTYGYVKGYSPSDAVNNDPFTTIDGILEKAQPSGDYYMPENILEKFKTVNANDNLKHPTKGQVVVGILYNLDTTGGNSGSPILNARGELVGVNFDRAFSATINDFEWNESYSRSIGVDIRYVLYVMKYVSGADAVLDELGVDL